MPPRNHIDNHPLHRRRNGNDVLPHPAFELQIHVEKHDSQVQQRAVLQAMLRRLRHRRLNVDAGILRQRDQLGRLTREMRLQRGPEGVHHAENGAGLESGGVGAEGGEVGFELGEAGVKGVVLGLLAVHQAGDAGGGVELGEQDGFLPVVVRLDHAVPGEAVVDEIGVVGGLKMGRLLVNAVVAEDEAVVDDSHVGGFVSEDIGLWRVSGDVL